LILDSLDNASRYYSLHSKFAEAFDFVKRNRFSAEKRVSIDDDRLSIIYSLPHGKTKNEAFLEAHRRYIDIHVCFEGVEEIGWRALQNCKKIDKSYNDEKDFITFLDEPQSWCTLHPNSFAILFPDDAHAPMVSEGVVSKAVVKVKVVQ
jgi:biofilm protein TabA